MTDIVDRLRNYQDGNSDLMEAAADEIEHLQEDNNDLIADIFTLNEELKQNADEIERLREALHKISLASQSSMDSKEGCGRIARAALEGK